MKNMKKIMTILSTLLLLTMVSCSQQRENMIDLEQGAFDGTLTLKVYAPEWDAETRALLTEVNGSLDLIASFRDTDQVRLFITQDDVLHDLGDVAFASLSEDGQVATLTITLPEGVDQSKPMNIIGYNGLNQKYITVNGNKAMISASAFLHTTIEKFNAPVYFRMENVTLTSETAKDMKVKFQHLGAYEIVHFENKSSEPIKGRVTLSEVSSYGPKIDWAYQNGYKSGKGSVYYSYDIISGEVNEGTEYVRAEFYTEPTIAPGEAKSVISWLLPNPEYKGLPVLVLDFYNNRSSNQSKGMMPAKTSNMEVGKVYHAYGSWDGSNVTFIDPETKEARPTPYISFTTNIEVGKSLTFKTYTPYGAQKDAWIDYNGNGVKDDITESAPANFRDTQIIVKSQKLTFHGGFESIQIAGQGITDIEVSPVVNLIELDVKDNQMSAEALNKLFEQLPDINHIEASILQSKKLSIDGNPGTESCNARVAMKKGWILDVVMVDETQPRVRLMLSNYGSKEMYFIVDAAEADRDGVWIDLNGDAEMTENEKIKSFGPNGLNYFEASNSTAIIYGNVTKLNILQGSVFAYIGEANKTLKYLNLAGTGIVAAMVAGHPELEFLNVNGNQLYVDVVEFDLKNLTKLKVLDMGNCQAGNVDLSKNTALTYLNIEGNGIDQLDVTNMPNLAQLICSNNKLETLDVSKAPKLLHLEAVQNMLSVDQINAIIDALPDRTGKSQGGFWVANNPGVGAAKLSLAKNKNWTVDARNSKADNKVRRPIMEGEDW